MVDGLHLALLGVAAAAGGAWLAVRVELRWLRSDVDRHERVIERHNERIIVLETETL